MLWLDAPTCNHPRNTRSAWHSATQMNHYFQACARMSVIANLKGIDKLDIDMLQYTLDQNYRSHYSHVPLFAQTMILTLGCYSAFTALCKHITYDSHVNSFDSSGEIESNSQSIYGAILARDRFGNPKTSCGIVGHKIC
ncbi:hypothetical protein AG1IA_00322 [Rhizoctonia solani AG-1 IA]|uniref:Uncharacterized protein n=1 Tax=Thanatephorus cucumeris (strain AG1-IA) TaxID=983506 RepID=L8X623_THACA|nr:hypothetical protein AG1IA_00322 [Rhizoctonia solani AG-1 IA]